MMNVYEFLNIVIKIFYDNPFLMEDFDSDYLVKNTNLYIKDDLLSKDIVFHPYHDLFLSKKLDKVKNLYIISDEDIENGIKSLDDFDSNEQEKRKFNSSIALRYSLDKNIYIEVFYDKKMDVFLFEWGIGDKEGCISRIKRNGSHLYTEDDIFMKTMIDGRLNSENFDKMGEILESISFYN